MTTITARCLLEAKYAENSQTTQYTSPTGTRTIIDKATATNDTGAPVTLGVNVVESGGAAGASNLVADLTVAAGTTDQMSALVGQVLNAGDFVSMIAGTASGVVIRLSGRQITG
jgi:hypothetical protein